MFSEDSFAGICNFSESEDTIASALRTALRSPQTLYVFFQRYTHFNGYASACIDRLASTLALSRYCFRDAAEPIIEVADRGMEIAAYVRAAAADEGSNGGVCHRTLAQFLLRTLGKYASLSETQQNRIADTPLWLSEIVQKLIAHYEGSMNDPVALIEGLGIHAASEFWGDRENALIDRVVRFDRLGESVNCYLNSAPRVAIEGHRYHPWAYILVHGSYQHQGVEADHWEAALAALNLCRAYSLLPTHSFTAAAERGFRSFVDLQQSLFQQIERECQELLDDCNSPLVLVSPASLSA
jgi:hypothetical protein